MGFRFFKKIKVAKGLSINVGKKGASVSAGTRGARVTAGTSGTTVSTGISGTGISYRKKIGNGADGDDSTDAIDDDTSGLSPETKIKIWGASVFFTLGVPMLLIGIFSRPVLVGGIIFVIVGVLCLCAKTKVAK